jgi:GT2 family glycosyltransferase
MPLVSIILTSFNHEKFIREAIESVLNQTFVDFELIIWDDASTDDSWEIIQSYTDSRIRAFKNSKNEGPCFGFNKAVFELSRGGYVAIHHSDDAWELNKLQVQVDFLDAHQNIGAVFTNAQPIDERGVPLIDKDHFYYSIFSQPNRTRHEWLRYFFLQGNALCHPSVLIRKNCYQKTGPYSDILAQLPDLDMWVRVCSNFEINVLPDPLVNFRVMDNEMNTSGSRPETIIRNVYEFYKVLQKYRKVIVGEELFKIFPELSNYSLESDNDHDYLLAKFCSESINLSGTFFLRSLLANEILFEILSDPKRRSQIEKFYGFGSREFFMLTGKNDVFSYQYIQKLSSDIGESDQQIQELSRGIGERDQQIQELSRGIGERDQQIQELNRGIGERDQQIQGLSRGIGERDQIVQSVLNSTSWKISEPLRQIVNKANHANSIIGSLYHLVFKRGGVLKSAKKAFRIIREEGWPGIVDRVKLTQKKDLKRLVSDEIASYDDWVARYGDFRVERGSHSQRISALKERPELFVVIIGDEGLELTTATLNNQVYSKWQLLADCRSITGGLLVVVRAGTALEQDALLCIVEAANKNSESTLFYADSDWLDFENRRTDPNFKPDWNPDLFYSCNYITPFWAARFSDYFCTVQSLELSDALTEWRFLCELVSTLSDSEINHIPYVLAHRTRHDDEPNETTALMLSSALSQEENKINVEPSNFGYRIRYPLPENLPLVSLIIPTRNGLDLLKMCLESIIRITNYKNIELIVVDNQSDDPATLSYMADLELKGAIKILRYDLPFNYSAINNFAVKQANGDLIGLINNDVEVISPEWLDEMVSHAIRPRIGAVGAKLYYPDGRIQHAGVILGLGGVASHAYLREPHGYPGMAGRCHLVQSLSAVTAACLIIKKSIFEEVGGLDEEAFSVAFNDVDFCIKVGELGYRNLWTPYAELIHHESATRGPEDTPEKSERFRSEVHKMNLRWGNKLFVDPAYNRNLTLFREDFSPCRPRC